MEMRPIYSHNRVGQIVHEGKFVGVFITSERRLKYPRRYKFRRFTQTQKYYGGFGLGSDEQLIPECRWATEFKKQQEKQMSNTHPTQHVMAPICEAIDAVLRGFAVRIANTVIKNIEHVHMREGIMANKYTVTMQFDIDDLLNGNYSPESFDGWDALMTENVKEFSIVDLKTFKDAAEAASKRNGAV